MANTNLSKLLVAGLLLGAGVAQAAGPASVSEVPASWYADRITTSQSLTGAARPVYPTAAYEHGPLLYRGVEVQSPLKRPSIAGSIVPFPASPNETGPVL